MAKYPPKKPRAALSFWAKPAIPKINFAWPNRPLNTMYDELSKVWPSCDSWNKQLHVKREEYHDGKLLQNVKLLEELRPP